MSVDIKYHWILRIYFFLSVIIDTILLLKVIIGCFITFFMRIFVSPKKKSLKGQLALVTGTGHGLGQALAKRLTKMAVRVICIDINDKLNNITMEEISKSGVESRYTL